MLRSFTVQNWKSYYEPVELSMIATRERRHGERLARVGRGRVLPVSAVYGANAAGKSTLVHALAALREIVLGARRPGAPLPVVPHLPEGKGEATFFAVEMLVLLEGGREAVLVYELEVDRRAVRREALLVRQGNQEHFLFERDEEGVNLDGPLEGIARVEAHAAVLAANETFLGAVGSDLGDAEPHLRAAYGWFDQQLKVIFPGSDFMHLPARFDADELFAEAMNSGMTRADTGIARLALEGMEVGALPLEVEDLDRLVDNLREIGGSFIVGPGARDYAVLDLVDGEPRARRLVARHMVSVGPGEEVETFTLPLREESDGTQRFMNLLPVLFQLREEDSRSVFVIDELENSMHPRLTEDFVATFLGDLGEGDRRQLIFTTHEVQLMRSDLLRRDEIWLADKEGGQSRLHRVSDFSDVGVRKGADLQSYYMSGRLGGVPRV